MKKTFFIPIMLLAHTLLTADEKIESIIHKSFSNPKTFQEMRDYYNKHIGITSPKKLDYFTVLKENHIKNKTIFFTKEVTVTKKNLKEFYNQILKYLGPENKIPVTYPYFIKTYNYETAAFFCKKFSNTDFFENGGKIKLKTVDDLYKKVIAITISSKNDCKNINHNYKIYMDTLKNMVINNKQNP